MTREMFDSLFGRGKSTPRPRAVAEESGGIERNRFRSNEEIYLSLFTDGYVLLPNMVEKPLVDKALRAINSSLGRNVPNRQDMYVQASEVFGSGHALSFYNIILYCMSGAQTSQTHLQSAIYTIRLLSKDS